MVNCIEWAKITDYDDFDNNRNTNGDERTTWRTFIGAFRNENNVEEDIGLRILVANYVQGRAWLLPILWCMSKNKRNGNSKSCKVGHKSFRGTIYEMGIWFCGANNQIGKYIGNKYILIGTNYAIKWVEVRALRTNIVIVKVNFLYECI